MILPEYIRIIFVKRPPVEVSMWLASFWYILMEVILDSGICESQFGSWRN